MGEAKPTPGPCYADGQVVHSDAVTCIAKFGDAYPDRRWSGTDFATEAHKEANAELFADALNVLTDTGLTPSQLVERVKELEEALSTIDGRLRQCFDDPITAREAYDFFYQEIVAAALSKARPNTAEGESLAENRRGDATQPVALPCADCGGKGVDGDVDDYGRTIDVPCGACNGTGRTPSRYRDDCTMGGGRCLGGCLSSEPCYYAARKQAAAKEPSP